MWYVLLVLALLGSAWRAIRASGLLSSALWLAGTSALLSLFLYMRGAQQIAVIELSIGAGLVTVLFVIAISIAGEDAMQLPALPPRWLAVALSAPVVLLLAWLALPATSPVAALPEPPFAVLLWRQRGLDMLVQVVLIFAGVMGTLGLLHEGRGERMLSGQEDVTPEPIEQRQGMMAHPDDSATPCTGEVEPAARERAMV